MRLIQIDKPGSYDRLRVVERPEPSVAPGQVRISTRSIGVNYADCTVRMGLYRSSNEIVGWPATPGFELAGVVDAVGQGVTDVQLGQQVVAVTLFGAYSTSVVVDRGFVFPLPPGFDIKQAGAFPVPFLTAWYALRELCKLRPGMKILVHSGAGGVGAAALQIARAVECEPVAVVGASHKVEVARKFGASAVIDKSSGDLWAQARRFAPDGFNVVMDANGVETLADSYAHLCPTGRLIVYGFSSMFTRNQGKPNWLKLAWAYLRTPRFNPLLMTKDNKAVLAFNLSYLFDQQPLLAEVIRELYGWCEQGKIVPLPVREYAFDDVAEAHRALETGTTTGKLVLIP